MTGHINHVIGATHNKHVAILIDESTISGQVVSGIWIQITLFKSRLIAPHGRETARRQRSFYDNTALLSSCDLLTFWIKNFDLKAGRWLCC